MLVPTRTTKREQKTWKTNEQKVKSTKQIQKKTRVRLSTEFGLVMFYYIWSGNESDLFFVDQKLYITT